MCNTLQTSLIRQRNPKGPWGEVPPSFKSLSPPSHHRFCSYPSAVLGLSPLPRGRGVRAAAAPGREGVERGAGAGGQPRVRAVQQAFPALLLQALVHPLQLEVPYHVWGAARRPQREKTLRLRRDGRGRAPGGAPIPDGRHRPAAARAEPSGAGRAGIGRAALRCCPSPGAAPVRRDGERRKRGGPAGRERWAGSGSASPALLHALFHALPPSARRLTAAHLSGEGGREPGSALPFPRPPALPGCTFSGSSQAGSASASALLLSPTGLRPPGRHEAPRRPPAIAELCFDRADLPHPVIPHGWVFLHFCQMVSSLLSGFYLTIFTPSHHPPRRFFPSA